MPAPGIITGFSLIPESKLPSLSFQLGPINTLVPSARIVWSGSDGNGLLIQFNYQVKMKLVPDGGCDAADSVSRRRARKL